MSEGVLARGRSFGSGLAVLLVLGCGDGGPGPLGRPIASYRPPARADSAGVQRVENRGPAQTLAAYESLPPTGASLLFLEGRSATPLPGGESVWVDLEGGRVLRFDGGGALAAVTAGRSDTSPLPGAVVRGTGSLAAAARTVFDITLAPLAPGDPLLSGSRGETA